MEQDKEQLLAKATRDYPAGTEFQSMISTVIFKIPVNPIFKYHNGCVRVIISSILQPDVCLNGQWAEIISKPDQIDQSAYLLKSYNPQLNDSSSSTSIDIESDPSYKELLNEEAIKMNHLDPKTDKFRPYKNWTEFIFYAGATTISIKELSAQRKYFELLLSEKETQFKKLELLKEHACLINKEFASKLEASEIEREKANATIEQQKREIEESREQVDKLRSYLSFSISFLNADDPVTDNIKELLQHLNKTSNE